MSSLGRWHKIGIPHCPLPYSPLLGLPNNWISSIMCSVLMGPEVLEVNNVRGEHSHHHCANEYIGNGWQEQGILLKKRTWRSPWNSQTSPGRAQAAAKPLYVSAGGTFQGSGVLQQTQHPFSIESWWGVVEESAGKCGITTWPEKSPLS